jgi:hypothetical protein
MTLHLYAVVLAGTALPEGTGVQDEKLDVVRSDDLAAVVSRVEADADATEADAIAHLDVITSLLATGPVIPVRFGTIAPDETAVREEVLDVSHHELAEYLRDTKDIVEVMVTIEFDEDSALRDVLSHDPPHGGGAGYDSMSDRIALGEDIAHRVEAAVREWSATLVGPACDHADAVTTLDMPEPTSTRFALLVSRERLARVDEALQGMPPAAAAGTVPYDVEYVGPLPPLDFPLQTEADDRDSSLWGW